MAHGSRKRWLRAAATGFGVLICTGLVGCLNSDKSKDTKFPTTTKQPGPGLPGMPTLQPGAGNLPAPKGPGTTQPYPNGNIIPTGGTSGFGTYPPRDGVNYNKTGPQQFNDGPAQPGVISPTIGTPGLPGVQPSGGVGMSPPRGGIAPNVPVPPLTETLPMPPLPPPHLSGPGDPVGGPLQPPIPSTPPSSLPLAPTAPPGGPSSSAFPGAPTSGPLYTIPGKGG